MTTNSNERTAGALRSENDALADQIKLLVRTEQKLYRTQKDLDRQLTQIQALSDLALRCSGLDDASVVLDRGAELLLSVFDLDQVVLFRATPEGHLVGYVAGASDAEPEPASAAFVQWASAVDRAELCTGEDAAKPLVEELSHLCIEQSADAKATCVYMPLRSTQGRLVAFVVSRRTGRSRAFFKAPVDESCLPFLQLFASHLERAIQATQMTSDLRQRGGQLADANRQLQSSLDHLERTQRQLLQSQKMQAIGRLAGGIAHDFNNLLTVILGHGHMLLERVASDADNKADVEGIVEAAERAAKITTQLLAFSRKQPRTPEVLNLNNLAQAMATMLRRIIGEHIQLDLKTTSDAACIRADGTQIEQVVLNLVVNARDAMPSGGVLTIESRPARPEDAREDDGSFDPARHAVVSVADTGCGMDAETRARIFEPFFTTKEVGAGTGMGLATVYGLVRQNGGFVNVRSRPGRGSCFTAVFPTVEAPSHAALESREAPHADQCRATVLVVEDEEQIRRLTSDVLESRGYRVLVASDGRHALEVADEHAGDIDLLLTDVVMPRLGGVELAQELARRRPGLVTLFVSGYTFQALEVPVGVEVHFLQKPFTPTVLLEFVGNALPTPGGVA